MYIVKIDGEDIVVTQNDLKALDTSVIDGRHHILENNKSYKVSKINTGDNPKTGTISINEKEFDFQILDQYDQVVSKMGLDVVATQKVTDIIAPMPGLILDIMIAEGDAIQEGDSILILEAMKMENVIKAEGEGIIKSINHKVGDTVEKGACIIEIE